MEGDKRVSQTKSTNAFERGMHHPVLDIDPAPRFQDFAQHCITELERYAGILVSTGKGLASEARENIIGVSSRITFTVNSGLRSFRCMRCGGPEDIKRSAHCIWCIRDTLTLS